MKIIIIIALSTLILLGCNQSKKNEIKIGVILPLTGEVATYGQSVKKGLDIAIGEKGEGQYKLIYEDSRADKTTALNVLEKLFFDKVNFFIGDATSSVTYEIGPKIQEKGGLLIVPIATGDKIRDIGPNVFMISPRNEKQTNEIANFIRKNYSDKKIACLYKQNDYGVNIASTFSKLFNDSIYIEAYQEGQNEFKSILLKLKNNGVKVTFIPGNYQETALILKQAKEINFDTQFIGTDGTYSPKLIELAGEASEGFLLSMMPVDYDSEMYKEFSKLYSAEYKMQPDIFASYGYESVIILMQAINSNKVHSVDETRDYLLKNTFNSLTGQLKFDEKGEAIRDYKIYKIKNSEFIPN